MMLLVDSHCHLDQLDLTPYGGDLNKAFFAAAQMDVKHFLCVCITLDHFQTILALGKKYDFVDVSVGLHPTENEGMSSPSVDELVKLAQDDKVVAIGETGLDYYRNQGDLTWQQNRFRHHIQAAKKVKKPLIIHSRQAKEDTLRLMQEEQAQSVGGVMHCFTEDWDMAQRAIELNFYISFSGIVTFRNAVEIQSVAKKVPLDRMLIETDSPYLAPNPHRGKPNEPAYVRFVAETIAELRGISVEEVAEHTTRNYFSLFGRKTNV